MNVVEYAPAMQLRSRRAVHLLLECLLLVGYQHARAGQLTQPSQLVFEVSTVRPADPQEIYSNLNLGADSVRSRNLPIISLLQFAYDLNNGSKDQIVGAPSWISSAPFDIEAKVDEATATRLRGLSTDERIEAMRQMIRSLLSDRFHLRVHHETRMLPVLALTISSHNAKLMPANQAPQPLDGWRGLHNPSAGLMEGRDVPIAALVNALSNKPEIGGRLVIDHTGLQGKYFFTLTWSPEIRVDQEGASDSGGPSLFSALQEQLGLRLESTKAPVDCIVVDHIEQPSPN